MSSFYTEEELKELGFKSIGKNVLISRKASIYGAKNISIGNSVRIDDFCILSGKITLGNYIHISAYTVLYGGSEGIIMKDFSGLSARVTVYAISDDFSGNFLTNPMVNSKYTNVTAKKVLIEKYVQVGASSVILPGVTIGEGSAIGAMSLVNRSIIEWTIASGVPAKPLKVREKKLLELEKEFLKDKE